MTEKKYELSEEQMLAIYSEWSHNVSPDSYLMNSVAAAEHEATLNGKEVAALREANEAMREALEVLIDKYWCNKGSDGTSYVPREFIACITPGNIPSYWRKASAALALADKVGKE